jgi:hypothetical protein
MQALGDDLCQKGGLKALLSRENVSLEAESRGNPVDENVTRHCDDCQGDYEEPVALPEGESGRCPRCKSVSWGWMVRSKGGSIQKQDDRVVNTIPSGKIDIPGKSVPMVVPRDFDPREM